MRRRPAAVLVASLVLLVLAAGVPGWLTGPRPTEPAPAPAAAAVLDALASLPLGFEPNLGQAEAGVDYLARGPGYRLALSATGADVTLPEAGETLHLRLVGSNPSAVGVTLDPLPGRTNYLTGDDPAAWQTGVPTFARVAYADVWPGVDIVFLGDQRRLRHDFVVAPGADPSAIAVRFGAAATEPTVDPTTGDLLVGNARLSHPVLYQDIDGGRRAVDGAFRLLGDGHVGFTVGGYDPTRPLVIDPTLVTSSYLGGSGIDNATAVDVDGGGNVYIAGSTESADFRATNPFQSTLNGDGSPGKSDAFVAKLNAEGTILLYATYLGGNNRDAAGGVAVAGDGTVYVTGVTESDNFPKTPGVAQENYGGGPSDAFVTKLNPAGSGLAWSTFVGGSQTDAARAVVVNAVGEAFVTGSTNSVEFPTANPFQQAAPRVDDVDAFVTKVSTEGNAFVFSTRLGGDNDDRGIDLAVDATGNAYVTGDTRSPGFPTARPLQGGAGGSASGVAGSFSDAFVTKFGPAGNNLVYSTFLGGSDTDQGAGIVVDGDGAAYVTGTTNSPNFPIKDALQERKDSDTDAFVSKVNPAGSELVYSTYLGGGGADAGTGLLVDRSGGVTVVGVTGSTNFPTAKPFQGVKGGGATDAFISTLAPAGATLVSSTYLGGREDDQAAGVAIGPGAATPVVVGTTSSADFPTAKPLQSARTGATADAFVTRISGAEDASPTTSIGTGGAVTTVPAKSGTHDKRVRLLVATTAALFLVAVLQTAYLRRKAATESSQWGPEQPAPLVPPPPVQTWGGGVRVIEEGDADDNVFANVLDDDRSGPVTVVGMPDVAVPDLLEDDWVTEVPAVPPLRPAPRVPLEELSFWDLFPEDLPPSRRPGAADDADWALEDQDVLIGRESQPPTTPPPPVPNPWEDVDPKPPVAAPPPPPPAAPAAASGQEDNVLLTELLDLSPAATQAANAAHYGNLIDAGGGAVGGRDDDGDDPDDDEADDGGSGSTPGTGGARARSGSGSGSKSSGTGPRKKRGGKRRPKPGGPSGGGGTSGTSGGGDGGGGERPSGGGGAGNLGG